MLWVCVFRKVCEQKPEQKREKNATGSRFLPNAKCNIAKFRTLGSRWIFFTRFSQVFTPDFDTNMFVIKLMWKHEKKTRSKKGEKKTTGVTKRIV